MSNMVNTDNLHFYKSSSESPFVSVSVKKKKSLGILRPKCLENPWPRLGLTELSSASKEWTIFFSRFSLIEAKSTPMKWIRKKYWRKEVNVYGCSFVL